MNKSKELIIIGAGETAMLAYEYFTHDSDYNVIGFAVESAFIQEDTLYQLPVFSLEKLEENFKPESCELFVAISSGKLNRIRADMYLRYKAMGYKFASYISSKAFVWHNVEIGENCFILEDNTLQPFVRIGHNVTLWSGNHIGHRTVIHDHCFISSHCVISGFCEIGENSFLGVNCTLEDNVSIESDNFIGAAALIQKNTIAKSFYQEQQTELSKVNTHRLFRIKES
ncbi:acetyltransferase [Thiomicrorhabdus sediminis]|uniref:Acetyltransferase n=1 Tax=Thiomicrorhabdus sediminis TaxID=2580412 RepID=A0A4P9K3T2_9GAMM|nr:acetyltransferase [Thiomicrorhabdus sediminis]QCU89562.1 acetyltransferase [Thiomicrorhabdus sediminis]